MQHIYLLTIINHINMSKKEAQYCLDFIVSVYDIMLNFVDITLQLIDNSL